MVDKNFNVLEFVKGTNYPTETVTVYTDAAAAHEYKTLTDKRYELDKRQENTDAITAQIEDAAKRIEASAIVFDLKGMPPKVVEAIMQREPVEGEPDTAKDDELISKTIVGVKNAEGAEGSLLSAEDVRELRGYLKEGEFGKLVQAVVTVNFNAAVFDDAVDAGFPGRRFDVAE